MDVISPHSYWNETLSAAPRRYPQLDRDTQTDVAIIGAGITGLTAAMHLKNAGRRVVVLEAGRVGAGTTGGTSGHLDAHPEQGARQLIRDFGEAAARIVTLGRMAAIAQIESWSRAFAFDSGFRRVPAYIYSETAEGAAELKADADAARLLGLVATPVVKVEIPFANFGGYRIENQARFHSLRYLSALAARVHGDGCTIYEQTRVKPPNDGGPCTIEAESHTVTADDVLVCTHFAFLGRSQFDMEIAPYQSYVMAVRVNDDFPDALFWDDADPYHYIRRSSSNDPQLLLVGGADHKTGQGGDEREPFHQLESYARGRFSVQAIEQRWSAEFFEPADGLPFIGRVPLTKHLHVGTGYSGVGLTFGTLAGQLLADILLDRSSDLAEILSPSRLKPIAAGGALLSENLNAARHYLMDRFRGESIESLDEIAVEESKLVQFRGGQWAVYRDGAGAMHAFSPVCPHMGCHVQWNEAEKTWDCPCHGGRFSALGERLYGPPVGDLKRQPLGEF
ncbi:MAG: FAD-dependent oxidoreductase [Planctomycetaceae bacterium]